MLNLKWLVNKLKTFFYNPSRLRRDGFFLKTREHYFNLKTVLSNREIAPYDAK